MEYYKNKKKRKKEKRKGETVSRLNTVRTMIKNARGYTRVQNNRQRKKEIIRNANTLTTRTNRNTIDSTRRQVSFFRLYITSLHALFVVV